MTHAGRSEKCRRRYIDKHKRLKWLEHKSSEVQFESPSKPKVIEISSELECYRNM